MQAVVTLALMIDVHGLLRFSAPRVPRTVLKTRTLKRELERNVRGEEISRATQHPLQILNTNEWMWICIWVVVGDTGLHYRNVGKGMDCMDR